MCLGSSCFTAAYNTRWRVLFTSAPPLNLKTQLDGLLLACSFGVGFMMCAEVCLVCLDSCGYAAHAPLPGHGMCGFLCYAHSASRSIVLYWIRRCVWHRQHNHPSSICADKLWLDLALVAAHGCSLNFPGGAVLPLRHVL